MLQYVVYMGLVHGLSVAMTHMYTKHRDTHPFTLLLEKKTEKKAKKKKKTTIIIHLVRGQVTDCMPPG